MYSENIIFNYVRGLTGIPPPCALIYSAFSWLSKEKVKGLLQLERVMVYTKAYYFFKVC